MNALMLMARAAALFHERLLSEAGCEILPVPTEFSFSGRSQPQPVWRNFLLRSRAFRRAHVETFDITGRLSVLHVCVLPHLDDPGPIFGFDMVAGPSRVTGIFLDLSPTTDCVLSPGLRDIDGAADLGGFAMPRVKPEWGDIFSRDMVAIRPVDLDEVSRAICLAQKALDGFLVTPRRRCRDRNQGIAAGQAHYMRGQRRNEHTFRMLASFIGAAPARCFIDEVLFPIETGMENAGVGGN